MDADNTPDNSDTKSGWLSSPVVLAILTAVFGLVGTGVGIILQAHSNTQLERLRLESTMIQQALETDDKNEAAKRLLFLVNIGVIGQLDSSRIRAIANDPDNLPVTGHPAIDAGYISVREAKQILSEHGYYKGPVDDNADEALKTALNEFQKARRIFKSDSSLGKLTNTALRKLEDSANARR